MQTLESRQNTTIKHLRRLGADREYREQCREYLLDGEKLFEEAVKWGAEITCVLSCRDVECTAPAYRVGRELLDYVSPLKTAQELIFSCRMPQTEKKLPRGRAIVLEGLQDPGNVGTVLRTANAFDIDSVVLVGCAELYNPKTVRAAMGALFRQRVTETTLKDLPELLNGAGMELYAAALSEDCIDVRELPRQNVAVAVGNEGRGLSRELIKMAAGVVKIPMSERCESLNAAVAASVIMWEMVR